MPSREHVHELPMRWADLDVLDHVNNVVYLDYAAESRAALVDDGIIPDRPVEAVSIRYVRPIRLTRRPLAIVATVDGDTLVQEVCLDGEDGRTVHTRIETRFGPGRPIDPHPAADAAWPAHTRRSDLDASGLVRIDRVFMLFQEARVVHRVDSLGAAFAGAFVVGTVEVEMAAPIAGRAEPYAITSWLSRVGEGSFATEAELADGDRVLARSTTVMVPFDLESQRSRRLTSDEKERLATLVR